MSVTESPPDEIRSAGKKHDRRGLWWTVKLIEVRLRFVLVLAAAFLIVAGWDAIRNYWDWAARRIAGDTAPAQGVSQGTEYFCPMDPGVLSDWPTKCPICNMALVLRKKAEAIQLPDGVVARMQLSPERVQLAGLATATVGHRPLARRIVAGGIVARGQATPDRAVVVVETAAKNAAFLAVGREAEAECEAYPAESFRGAVVSIGSSDGGSIGALRTEIELTDPDGRLWDGAFVTVTVFVPLAEIEPFREISTELPPLVEGSPRTVYFCLEHPDSMFDKPGTCPIDDLDLRPRPLADNQRVDWWCPMHPEVVADHTGEECTACRGMRLIPRVASYRPPGEVLAVRSSAVIDTGSRQLVYIERSPGMFDCVEVRLGPRADQFYSVVAGLQQGDSVVAAGAFLVDAETRLNSSIASAYFGATQAATDRSAADATTIVAANSDDEARFAKALEKLPAQDRAQAEEQRICPITKERLGSMGTPVAATVNDRRLFLCCAGCEAALEEEPEKILAWLDRQESAARNESASGLGESGASDP